MVKNKIIMILLLFIISCMGFSQNKTTHFIPNEKNELIAKQDATSNDNYEKEIEKEFPQPEFQGAFFKMILAVIAVIVLGFITFWAFRKLTRARIEAANSNKAIKVLEKRILSPKSILYLIEYEGKKILISESHLDMKIKVVEK